MLVQSLVDNLHTRLPIKLHIKPIEHLDCCCPTMDQSAYLNISFEGQKASQVDYSTFSKR